MGRCVRALQVRDVVRCAGDVGAYQASTGVGLLRTAARRRRRCTAAAAPCRAHHQLAPADCRHTERAYSRARAEARRPRRTAGQVRAPSERNLYVNLECVKFRNVYEMGNESECADTIGTRAGSLG